MSHRRLRRGRRRGIPRPRAAGAGRVRSRTRVRLRARRRARPRRRRPTPIATRTAERDADRAERRSRPTAARSSPDAVLDELGDTPLNDPAFGPSGSAGRRQPRLHLGGSCRRHDAPDHDDHAHVPRPGAGPAQRLADDEGFTCYTPDGGTRCEKTWQNEQYPVTDGRTLFWRDDILIDTTFSNLAPSGYTSAIVEHVCPSVSSAAASSAPHVRRERAPYSSGCHAVSTLESQSPPRTACSSTTSPRDARRTPARRRPSRRRSPGRAARHRRCRGIRRHRGERRDDRRRPPRAASCR